MSKLWLITSNTLKMLIRNKQTLFFALFVPLLLMLVIGFLTRNNDNKLNIGVVYNDTNETARNVVDQLKKIDGMEITIGSLDEEKKQLEDNKRDLVVILPDDFSFVPRDNNPSKILLFENISNPTQSFIAQTVINQVFEGFTKDPKASPKFVFEKQQVTTQDIRYIDFLVPGIISMTIMQLGIFGTAFAIVDAKQKGVLRRVMATPVKPWEYIGGSLIARLLLSIVQAGIIVAVAYFVFDINFKNWGWLLILIIIGNIVFLSIGLFVSGISKTIEAVPVIANLIAFPMLLLGNVFFPTDGLPGWIRVVVEKLPIAILADLIREMVTLGKKVSDVWPSLLMLIAWAIAMVILANMFFKLQEKD